MTRYTVTVPRLNVRSRIPQILPDSAGITGTVAKDYTFTGTEVPEQQIPNPDMGKWYQDTSGNYYWGGGIMETGAPMGSAPLAGGNGGVVLPDFQEGLSYADKKAAFIGDPYNRTFFDVTQPAYEPSWKVNWGIVDLEVWRLWKLGINGKGVTVAIIDSGVNALKLQNNAAIDLNRSYNVIDGSADIHDGLGHGTNVAGLIIPNGANGIYGIAPGISLVVIKINMFLQDSAAAALEHIANMDVDIISMSFGSSASSPRFDAAVQSCLTTGKILLAACGDDNEHENNYPASMNGVISVGAYQLTGGQRARFPDGSSRSDNIKMVLPGKDLLDIGTDDTPKAFNKTSAATAFAAGTLALVLSGINKTQWPDRDSLIGLLPQFCRPIVGAGWNESEGYGVLSPLAMYKQLKSQ